MPSGAIAECLRVLSQPPVDIYQRYQVTYPTQRAILNNPRPSTTTYVYIQIKLAHDKQLHGRPKIYDHITTDDLLDATELAHSARISGFSSHNRKVGEDRIVKPAASLRGRRRTYVKVK